VADLPIAVRLTLFFGAFAVIAFVLTLAQRLGEVRSKPLSRVLGAAGFLGCIVWIKYGVELFFRVDLADDFPKTFWTALLIVSGGGIIWAVKKGWFGTKVSTAEQIRLPVYGAFSGAYAAHASDLGSPITAVQVTPHAYQGSYEHAMVIWIEKRSSILMLPADSSRHFEERPDPDWATTEWCADAEMRTRFNAPKDQLPPFGAIAKQWYRDPAAWMWIGWRQWHSGFADVSYQEFERGLIIGSFKYHELNPKGRIFVALKDGRWFSELSPEGPSAGADWWSESVEAYLGQKSFTSQKRAPELESHCEPQPQSLPATGLSQESASLAEGLSNQFLQAKDGEIPVQIRAHRDGIVAVVKQIQDFEKALPARIVVSDIRQLQDGKLATTRLLHSDSGRFSYDAIQLQRAPSAEGDLHYGEEGLWWIVSPSKGQQYLRMFWPDRPTRPNVPLPPGDYIAYLRIWVGDRNLPFQVAWAINTEQRATISGNS
jgi:hypothetical protein